MKPLFSGVRQIGVVVADLDKTVNELTEEYGFGPWYFFEVTQEMSEQCQTTTHGKLIPQGLKAAKVWVGNVEFEFVQPTDENSCHAEFLREHGPGLQHIQFYGDYEVLNKFFTDKKVPTLTTAVTPFGVPVAYFDTKPFIIEIAKHPPEKAQQNDDK